MTEHAEIVTSESVVEAWQPIVGKETQRFFADSNLDESSRERVLNQSLSILGASTPFASPGSDFEAGARAGLVVGFVQSGKTQSFTAVTTLARDNRFPIVIVLAGTKTNLVEQTRARLAADLKVARPGGMSPWWVCVNPRVGDALVDHLESNMLNVPPGAAGDMFRRTAVVVLMKNATRIDALTSVIKRLRSSGALASHAPVLLIDDEADQASLNTKDPKSGEEPSATYRAISDLRAALPRHTYLMYTATPQAPLLLDIADAISPDFVKVLSPGDAYTGGEYFFREHRNEFVVPISTAEVQASQDPTVAEPPDSLLRALATFLTGVVARQGELQLSMLIHPSHTKELHTKYHLWVVSVLNMWSAVLQAGGADADELLDEYFAAVLYDLKSTDGAPVTMDTLRAQLGLWITQVRVQTVNSAPGGEDINWQESPAWILVGGNKLDRGFTVEGLAVTYMPRGTGVGNVDSVQQRARFFGYKKDYAGLCRAWLHTDTSRAFEDYVEHETHLRGELERLDSTGKSLRAWKRKMLLDPSLKPCRASVIRIPTLHSRVAGSSWARFEKIALLSKSGASQNAARIATLLLGAEDLGVPAQETRTSDPHRSLRTSLSSLLDTCLVDYQTVGDDRTRHNQLLLVLGAILDEADRPVMLIHARGGRSRERQLLDETTGAVLNLHEGPRPSGDGFPGDAAFFDPEQISVQLFSVDVLKAKGGPVTRESLPAFACRIPASLAKGALVEVCE